MDSVAKVEYHVRNLTTRSVTLFPARAEVFRDIKDVPLQPGTNEVTIYGLSPTVDEESIKVNGKGSAIISDIVIESIPNRDLYEDIYPESDDDTSDVTEEDCLDEEPPEHPEAPELIAANARLLKLMYEEDAAEEAIDNANQRRMALDTYAQSLKANATNITALEDAINSYKKMREDAYKDMVAGEQSAKETRALLEKCKQEVSQLEKIHRREADKAMKDHTKAMVAKDKAQKQLARRKEEKEAEKKRVKKERQKFWPKYCFAVRIQLEAGTLMPPASRRGSIASDIEIVSETMDVYSNNSDRSDYQPTYDMQLSTINATGALCFDAQLSNATSETWEKCKLTLSTSLASPTALDDKPPTLLPWRIKLGSRSISRDENCLTYSTEEHNQKRKHRGGKSGFLEKERIDMFGINTEENKAAWHHQTQPLVMGHNMKRTSQEQEFQQQYQQRMQQGPLRQIRDMRPQASGQTTIPPPPPPPLPPAARPPPPPPPPPKRSPVAPEKMQTSYSPVSRGMKRNHKEDDQGQNQQQLEFEESFVEESGFMTTYDLPGLKTLAPKSTMSKQRISRIHFTNVIFKHTVVAKYKQAAYLSAKLQNNSKLTLLRGPVGVTLDGSFIGRTSLPRCAAGGECFNLRLGVDPAIRVAYATPSMHRASAGFFTKEEIKVYERAVRLENTRSAAAKDTKILVRDQIPVSDDDSLCVKLHEPKDLTAEDSNPAGEAVKDKETHEWGSSDVTLKKNGEITWLLALRPGKSVKLALQYTVAAPIGDHAVEA